MVLIFPFHGKSENDEYILHISAKVKTKGNTGVEMEALTAASVCASNCL